MANNKSHFQKVSFIVHYPSDTNLRIKISLIGLRRRFQQLKLKKVVKTICKTTQSLLFTAFSRAGLLETYSAIVLAIGLLIGGLLTSGIFFAAKKCTLPLGPNALIDLLFIT